MERDEDLEAAAQTDRALTNMTTSDGVGDRAPIYVPCVGTAACLFRPLISFFSVLFIQGMLIFRARERSDVKDLGGGHTRRSTTLVIRCAFIHSTWGKAVSRLCHFY